MISNRLVVLYTLIFFSISIQAQEVKRSENIIGINYTISSEVLNENREIQVYVPESYSENEQEFPVLYILDGQRFFPYAISLLKSFTQFRLTPQFIIVGITNKYPDRFGHFIDEEKKFLSFLEREVIPFVDNNYRTSTERILFGWEYAGSFVVQTLIDNPTLFNAQLVASPFPLENKISEIDDFISNKSAFDNSLYFSVSPNENQVNVGTKKLDSILELKAPKKFNWRYKMLKDEEHLSTSHSTLYFGIKNYFEFYPELQFNSLDEFEKDGGLDYVYYYYEQRALKYGFSKQLSDWTMFSLTRNAIRANNFEEFDKLMNEFYSSEFLSRIRVNRACSIAEFYLKNEKYDMSIKLFEQLSELHPNSEWVWNGLGDSYKAIGNDKKATENYKKAESLNNN